MTLLGPPDPAITSRESDGGRLLLHATDPRVLVLNDTADAVWQLCDGTRTFEQVLLELAGCYGVSAGDLREDVVATLDRFVSEGFLPDPAT